MPLGVTYNLSDKQKAEAIADEFVERGIGMGGGGGGGGAGDASAANQVTQIDRLTTIRDRTPALGENAADGSTPVVIATTGTFASAIGAATDASATGDAGNTGLISLIKRTNSRITSLINTITGLLPSTLTATGNLRAAILESLPSGDNFIGSVGGRTVSVNAIFTRPSDTIAYASGDGITDSTAAPAAINFTNSARVVGGSGLIMSARLVKSSNSTGNANFRLWLYSSAPANVPNDNSAFSITFSNRSSRIGYVDFSNLVAGGDCAESFTLQVNLPFKLTGGNLLFGILEARGAYVPTSGEQWYIELGILQD